MGLVRPAFAFIAPLQQAPARSLLTRPETPLVYGKSVSETGTFTFVSFSSGRTAL